MSDDIFTDNAGQRRYELHTGGHKAIANYRKENGTLFIDYVEAPPELRGTGAAGRLMQHVMDAAKAESLEVVPICGYAAAWIKKNVR